MITQQIRAWEVLNDDVLDLIEQVPRELFVPAEYKNLAYADFSIPLPHGQFMLPPKEIGKIIEALDILPTETVLEIGTGSGYLTTLLAKQAQHVYSVDLFPDITTHAKQLAKKQGVDNITFLTGEAAKGWPQNAPYDVIVLTGSLAKLPSNLKNDLNISGRIFAVTGNNPSMQAMLLTKVSDTYWEQRVLYETSIARLMETTEQEHFSF